MIAYHGSTHKLPDDLALLMPSKHGSFGSGFYLGDKAAASLYADSDHLHEFWVDDSQLLRVDACFEIAEPFDLDTAALPLLARLFNCSVRDAANVFSRLTCDGFLLGAEVAELVQNEGYAGLYLDYGTCFEVVVSPPFDVIKPI